MTSSTTSSVAQFLEDQLQTGALSAGDKLPTERALAALLGITRHEVRRQLDVLESQGRVAREVGRGTFLTGTTRPDAESGSAVDGLSPLDLIEARAAWEPNLMTLVAVAATAEDFDEIRRCLSHGEATQTPEEFMLWDIAFHRALAAATHNTVVAALNEMVENGRRQLAGTVLDQRRYSTENCATCQHEHRAIAEAIFDRDGARAQAAMRSHLETVRGQLLG